MATKTIKQLLSSCTVLISKHIGLYSLQSTCECMISGWAPRQTDCELETSMQEAKYSAFWGRKRKERHWGGGKYA